MSPLIHDTRPLFWKLLLCISMSAWANHLIAQDFRILHYTQTTGWDHGTADESLQMFQELGVANNFAVEQDVDGTSFNDLATLQQYDVIVWSNTSGSYNLDATQRANFEAYIQGGGSYLGIHAASDTYRHSTANGGDTGIWDFYAEEVCGGSVQNAPNHTAQNFNADLLHLGTHASLANIPNPWNKAEEYYYWENGYLSPNITEVLRVVSTGTETYDIPRPISWYMNISGGGRSFYTALGHDPDDYTNDTYFRNHIRDALLWVANANTGGNIEITGELKKWHTITLILDGITTTEDATYNPFLNYRMDVSFTNGNKTYVVPGYFAADGNASESSANGGNKWRAHFTPDEEGAWNYSISFRTGTNVAVDDNPLAGTSTAYDGLSGSFNIGSTDKTGNDLRAKGRLEFVDEHYLRFSETGEYFFKGGSNSPENFLGYVEFDNTYDNGGNGNALHTTDAFTSQGNNYNYAGDGLHYYEPHIGDWQNGDPSWQNGKGKGIIGAINYLASEEVNALYFLTMNVDGDGREVFPWTEYWMRDRFDVSKLDQWEIVFAHMEEKGIVLHMVLQEQENDQLLDGGYLGTNRKLYLRELIARFGHHLGILWNLGEENTNTHQQRLDMATFFDQNDPYHHFIGVHTFIGQQQDIYGQIIGDARIDGASLQMDLIDIHDETKKWVTESQIAGRKWAVFSDEIGPFQTGVSPDGLGNNHLDIRRYALYGNLFAGGGGAEWYFGYDEDHNDLDCEDFRSRDQMWDYTRIARQFMQDHATFLAMRPADELVDNANAYCLAWDSVSYLIYNPNGSVINLDLQTSVATYQVKWFNPRTGGALQDGSITSVIGPGLVNIGLPPEGSTEDWIAVVGNPTALSANTSPTFSASQDIFVVENFTATETVMVTPDPVPANELLQTVTYSLSPAAISFANVIIDPNTGNVSITAVTDSSGTQQFIIIADDGQAYNNIATDTFMLIVQPAQVISPNVNINTGGMNYIANGGEIYEADKDFTGGGTFVAEVAIANTLDDTLYHSERTAAGGFGYSIPVANNQYKVLLHFAEIFHTTPGNRVMDVSLEGNLVLDDYDIVADVGAFTAVTKEFTINITDGYIDLNFSASVDQPKISAIQIALDTILATANTPPTFSIDPNNLNLFEDFATPQTITVTPDTPPVGEETQAITYSLTPATIPFADVQIDPATGLVTVSSLPDDFGTQIFTITADDGQAEDSLATQQFSLTINSVNDPPDFSVSGDITVDENFVTTETVSVAPNPVPTDEQGQTVFYSLVPGSVPFANVSIDPLTGEVTITAVPNANGSQQFTITANDGQLQNNLASQTFMLTVNPLNQAPTFSMSGDLDLDEDFVGTQQIMAVPDPVPSDEGSQIVTYSLSPATIPFANMSIDPVTGTVSVDAIQDLFGSQTFTVTADDGQVTNNLATSTFTLTVNSINDAPTFNVSGDINVDEDFVTIETVDITPDPVPIDEVGESVAYSLSPSSVAFANVSIDPTTGTVTITSIPTQSGSQVFTITADDGQGVNNLATNTFTLTVNLINNTPPTFSISGDVIVNEDFSTTEIITATPDSVPPVEAGQTVIYSLSPSSIGFANVSIDSLTGAVFISAVADSNGVQLFTITANDGQANNNSSTQTFTLTVEPVNDEPTFTYSGDVIAQEDFGGTHTVVVTPFPTPLDEQEQTVTYSLMPATVPFANMSIDPSTGLVSITSVPDEVGSQYFTIRANDGESENNMATVNFLLIVNQVNDPPVFTLSGDVIVDENFPGTEQVTVTAVPSPPGEETQQVLYALDPPAIPFANVSIDENTGTVSITAVPDFYGAQVFTVYANDGSFPNNVYAQTFTLTVNQTDNTPPTFTLSGDITVDEDFTTTEVVTLTPDPVPLDEQGEVVVYSINPQSVAFANISFDSASGEVTITSVPNANGSQVFTITADDGEAFDNLATDTFTLTVNEINEVPSFTHTGDITADEDFAGTRNLTVMPDPVSPDETDQIVVYSLYPANVSFANVSIDSATGNITVTSIQDSTGVETFTITADDGQANNNLFTSTFTLRILPQNDAPSFVMSGNVIVEEDFTTTEIVNTIPNPVPDDELGQNVTYSISPASVTFANVILDPATGTVMITAVPNGVGSRLFTITANDGEASNNLAIATFTLTVNPVNDPPNFVMSGDVNVLEDFTTTEIVTVIPDPVPSDEQTQVVSYSITPASVPFANVSFDPSTGTVTITSIPGAFGTQVFTITANDGQAINTTANATFTLTVNEVNDPPTFSVSGDIVVEEDFTTTEIVTVTPDPVTPEEADQVVTYSLVPASVSFANVNINPNTGEVIITAIADMSGTQEFTIIADDGENNNNLATQTFTLTINPINDLPVFVMDGNLMLEEDFSGIELVSVIQGPVPADEVGETPTYSLSPSSVAFANVNIDPNTGQVSIAAIADASGSQVFTVTANDGQTVNNIFSQTFSLEVGPINDAPTFTHSGDIYLAENFPGTSRFTVTPDPVPTDEQGQTVVYNLNPATINFANINFDSSTGNVDFTAIQDSCGTQVFIITANDGQNEHNTAVDSFIFSVSCANNPPVFSLSGDIVVDEDFAGTETVHVTPDPVPIEEQGQIVTYSLEPGSVSFANVHIDSNTGTVSITSVANGIGIQEFIVVADDGQSEFNIARDTFLLQVNPINDAPTFSLSPELIEESEDFVGTRTITLIPDPVPTDEVGQTVMYSLMPANVAFANVNIEPNTGRIAITAVPDGTGEQTFVVIADDGQSMNGLTNQTFTLRILPENDPPTFSVSRDITVSVNFTTTEVVSVTPDPVPEGEKDQIVTYSLSPPSVSFANVQFNSNTGEVQITAVADSFGMQVFVITADDGQSMNHTAVDSFKLTVLPPEPISLRINAGADRDMAFGQYLFIADTFHSGGDVFYNPLISDMLNTTWDELYRSERNAPSGVNSFLYDIPLQNGDYIVYLHFAETYWGAFGGGCCGNIGERIFNVEVEGVPEMVNFDMLAEAGPMTAIVKDVPVSVDDGNLFIRLEAIEDRPSIKAIEIIAPGDSSISQMNNPNNTFVDPIYNFGPKDDTTNAGNMLIYPNPVPDDMTVLLENTMDGILEAFIYDNFGKRYMHFTVEKSEQWATFTFPVTDLVPGYYVIHFLEADTGLSIARKFWKVE